MGEALAKMETAVEEEGGKGKGDRGEEGRRHE
jgi:hypothetical protein